MNARWVIAAATLLLGGCLEVQQHPAWRDGQYNGKPDNLAPRRVFHGDRLAWNAAITNRNWQQDEYQRTLDKGAGREL